MCQVFAFKVLEVVGIIMTNGFEVSPGSLQGVYELPSMMNHECVGNARLTMDADEHRICVYAASKEIIRRRPPLGISMRDMLL